MRCNFDELGINLLLEENSISVLVAESAEQFSKILSDLEMQATGMEGNFCFFDDEDKILNVSKTVDVIMNPFALDSNDKRIRNKLYQYFEGIATDECQEVMADVNADIMRLLENLNDHLEYMLCYDLNLDINGLLKLYDVEIDIEEQTLCERILNYCILMKRYCGIKVFCFVNLKLFLSEQQLSELYHDLINNKIFCLMIETVQRVKIEYEKNYILDQNLCLIEI